ncbi:MAG: YezD family protein [Candidatus Omnitrophica bacterium]|nr:YezD family protein [Candidatus Omnitrophota bacterium]MDE2008650.1 YezD family protein [Candidatus Omnitrophota bacterium]MDE2214967.1 YezD family protein [Candidatus Omnitrophota bacterium]MDE2230906.1 YezD family protein [Candidatus Omnitrophota bacterium]
MLPSKIKQIKDILKDLKKIRYGSVEIIVHNGQIIQIEKKEKIRVGIQSRQTA